jgi:hypothetical protein
MERSLDNGRLFGIRKSESRKITSAYITDAVKKQHRASATKKAMLEAECRKAQAITILRRHTLIR